MGIQVQSNVTQPSVVFDKVFLRNLTIEQTEFEKDSLTPHYKIYIEYRLYGVMEDTRYYHSDIREIEINDFIAEAMRKAQIGDMVLISALPAIEAAIAKLVEGDLNTVAEVI